MIARVAFFLALALSLPVQAQTETPCPKKLPAATTCWNGRDENGAFYWIARPARVHSNNTADNASPQRNTSQRASS